MRYRGPLAEDLGTFSLRSGSSTLVSGNTYFWKGFLALQFCTPQSNRRSREASCQSHGTFICRLLVDWLRSHELLYECSRSLSIVDSSPFRLSALVYLLGREVSIGTRVPSVEPLWSLRLRLRPPNSARSFSSKPRPYRSRLSQVVAPAVELRRNLKDVFGRGVRLAYLYEPSSHEIRESGGSMDDVP